MSTYEDGLLGEFIYGGTTPGYEGELWKHYWKNCDYAVSTYGRVYSCKSKIFLKPENIDGEGHLAIHMYHLGTKTCAYVHRMVAEMFIPNPDNLPVVRHLDGNPTNNTVLNLAWGTQRDNWDDAVRHGTATAVLLSQSQPVIAISESDGLQTWFSSQHEAARKLQLHNQNISACLNGQRSHTGGYTFVRAEGGEANAEIC